MHANTHISYTIVLCCTDNWKQFVVKIQIKPLWHQITPQVDQWPHNLDLEGLKLMYMHESYTSSQAMLHGQVTDLLAKINFWPLWPQMTSDWPLTSQNS